MAACLFTCLFLVAGSLFAQSAPPNRSTPPRTIEHAVLVIDTSFSMANRTEKLHEAIQTLILQGVQGRLTKGDVLHVWTFSEQVNTSVFPSRTWDPATNESLARQVLAFTSKIKFDRQTRLDRALRAILSAARSVERATFIILSDGNDAIRGTPFDSEINADYRSRRRELRRDRDALLTFLNSERGQVSGWMVATATDVAKAGLKLQTPAPPAPSPLTDSQAAQPSSFPTQPRPSTVSPPNAVPPSTTQIQTEPFPSPAAASKPPPPVAVQTQPTSPPSSDTATPVGREPAPSPATTSRPAESQATPPPDRPRSVPTSVSPLPESPAIPPEARTSISLPPVTPNTPPSLAAPRPASSSEKPASQVEAAQNRSDQPVHSSPAVVQNAPTERSDEPQPAATPPNPTTKGPPAMEAKHSADLIETPSSSSLPAATPEPTRPTRPSPVSPPATTMPAPPADSPPTAPEEAVERLASDVTPPGNPPVPRSIPLPEHPPSPQPVPASESFSNVSKLPPTAILEPTPTVVPVLRSWWIGILFLLMAATAFWISWRKAHRRSIPSLISQSIGDRTSHQPPQGPPAKRHQPPPRPPPA